MKSMTTDQMAASYYRACHAKQRPEFVPQTVMVLREVRSDMPFMSRGSVAPGLHAVECNQWGAVSAFASDGKLLGLRPNEFDVLTWSAVKARS
jgi:hypothetical protein